MQAVYIVCWRKLIIYSYQRVSKSNKEKRPFIGFLKVRMRFPVILIFPVFSCLEDYYSKNTTTESLFKGRWQWILC